jgi:hypothetical protein
MSEESKEIVKSEIEISPQKTIERGKEMAQALKSVVDNKSKPVIINGEKYLEFEDWQTLGRFFSYSVRTSDAQPVEVNGVKGAKAKAEVIDNKTGLIIGSAEAYCLYDEKNWENKPFFQLASMSQTRAGAKALRNVLAWVVVLAGYKATPAEEMIGTKVEPKTEPKAKQEPEKPQIKEPLAMSTEAQQKAIHSIITKKNFDEKHIKEILGIEHFKELNKGGAGLLIDFLSTHDEFNEQELYKALEDMDDILFREKEA